jgi:hypothetical protein
MTNQELLLKLPLADAVKTPQIHSYAHLLLQRLLLLVVVQRSERETGCDVVLVPCCGICGIPALQLALKARSSNQAITDEPLVYCAVMKQQPVHLLLALQGCGSAGLRSS